MGENSANHHKKGSVLSTPKKIVLLFKANRWPCPDCYQLWGLVGAY
jgi:hypothetical protein